MSEVAVAKLMLIWSYCCWFSVVCYATCWCFSCWCCVTSAGITDVVTSGVTMVALLLCCWLLMCFLTLHVLRFLLLMRWCKEPPLNLNLLISLPVPLFLSKDFDVESLWSVDVLSTVSALLPCDMNPMMWAHFFLTLFTPFPLPDDVNPFLDGFLFLVIIVVMMSPPFWCGFISNEVRLLTSRCGWGFDIPTCRCDDWCAGPSVAQCFFGPQMSRDV